MTTTATDQQSPSNGRDEHGRFIKGHRKGFQRGQSGNPQGRPKSVTLSEALRHVLGEKMSDTTERTYAETIARVLCEEAAEGNVSAAREIADRTEGRPKQAIDLDLSVLDWREMARAHGIDEHDVIQEAKQLIGESALDSGGVAAD